MSEVNLVRRTCNHCGDVQEFDNRPMTELSEREAARIAGWAVLVRVFLVNGQTYPVQLHACKDSCAVNLIKLGQLDLPQVIKDQIAEQKKLESARLKAMAEGLPKKSPLQFAGVPVEAPSGEEFGDTVDKYLPVDLPSIPADGPEQTPDGLIPVPPAGEA